VYLKWGSYRHEPWEANLLGWVIRPKLSNRGFLISNKVEAHVSGDLVLTSGEDQYDLSTKIQGLMDALDTPFQDFGLYHDNDSPTPHFLESDHVQNVTGNRVIFKRFPSEEGNGEYASGRAFQYVVAAEIQNTESLILEYNEVISHTGTTGPLIQWRNTRNGPRWDVIYPSTFQTVVQQGTAVTLGTYLAPPDPILGVPYNMVHQNFIQRRSPKRYPQGVEGYVVSWKYIFHSHTPVVAMPSTR
jgi:hypothetical protein